MRPNLSFDHIAAVLAALGTSTAIACGGSTPPAVQASDVAPTQAAPGAGHASCSAAACGAKTGAATAPATDVAPATPAAAAPAAAPATPAATVAAAATPPASPPKAPAPAPAKKPAKPKPAGEASCGQGTCSADAKPKIF